MKKSFDYSKYSWRKNKPITKEYKYISNPHDMTTKAFSIIDENRKSRIQAYKNA